MIIPASIDIHQIGQFCSRCYSRNITYPAIANPGVIYDCKDCGYRSDRCLVTGGNILAHLDENRNLWHTSVGVAFVTPYQELLCIERAFYPRALALPAGHVEVDEDPLSAAVREIREELGLSISPSALQSLPEFDLPGDSCRRGSDHHHWHLFTSTCDHSFANKILFNDEAKSVTFVNLSSIDDRSDFAPALSKIVNLWGLQLRQRARLIA